MLVRGELSDLMIEGDRRQDEAGVRRLMDMPIVPRVGHAPMLTEPAAVEAIDDFLARVP